MKTLKYILLSAVVFAGSYSGICSQIHVDFPQKGHYTVILDGESYQVHGDELKVNNVHHGTHFVRIARSEVETYRNHPVYKKRILYSGQIFINPDSRMDFQMDRNGQFYTINRASMCNPNDMSACSDEDEYSSHLGHCNSSARYSMSHESFQNLLYIIDARSFDQSKESIAKQSIQSNSMSSAQVSEIMKHFSFETTRLDFAEFAYSRVVDPQNFFLVNDGFSFDSSIRNLDDFIRRN